MFSEIDYKIEVEENDEGYSELSLKNATKGTKVTYKITPKNGYKLSKVIVLDSENNEIEVDTINNSFIMPDSDVTFSAIYEIEIVNPKTGIIDVSFIMGIICVLGYVLYRNFKSQTNIL